MNLFMDEIVIAPAHLPITVSDAQADLAAAVTEECERSILWRALVAQQRKIIVDGPLPHRIEIEPVGSIVSITRWTPTDDAEVIPALNYSFVTRDPAGCIIQPNSSWPQPQRSLSSFAITYECGWEVAPESAPGAGDGVNNVPASVRLMVERAISFRAGSGLGNIEIGSLKIDVAPTYRTDRIPPEIAGIGKSFQYRPGVFSARP